MADALCGMNGMKRLAEPALLLILLIITFVNNSVVAFQMATPQHQYPRPLHPGGFSLPPLVEDRLPIVPFSSSPKTGADDEAATAAGLIEKNNEPLRSDILLVKPPDMESLWEWYAYTKRQSDSDPSWGRVWPTALSLARLVLRSMNNDSSEVLGQTEKEQKLMKQALQALRSAPHAVEVGCGLGVAGLAYASSVAAAISSKNDEKIKKQRTITFLDREPYALHCVMASASTNGIATGPMEPFDKETTASVVARAAIDDWTLPSSDNSGADEKQSNSPIKNVCYQDLHCNNEDTILLASDILYEPSSMQSLARKLKSLVHPIEGGYALIADPQKERTPGCRSAFVEAVKELNGNICEVALSDLQNQHNSNGLGRAVNSSSNGIVLLEDDIDIDGSLAKTVLIVVHFEGDGPNSK